MHFGIYTQIYIDIIYAMNIRFKWPFLLNHKLETRKLVFPFKIASSKLYINGKKRPLLMN